MQATTSPADTVPAQKLVAPLPGTLVEYGMDSFGKNPAKWRVKSWLRVARPLPAEATWIDEILHEAAAEVDTKTSAGKQRMEFCPQEEATHVSLTGICGAIAPIEKCKVLGMVDWSPEMLEQERLRAVRMGELRSMV